MTAQSLALHNICAGLGMTAQSLGMAVKNSETHSVVELRRQVDYRRAQQVRADEGLSPRNQRPNQETSVDSEAAAESKKNRGKRPWLKDYGRKRRTGLSTEEIGHELPKEEQCCPICGKPFTSFPGSEDSEEIHWEVHLIRHVHKRARYRPTCNCRAVPGIVTTLLPPKLIPKGMFSCGFWVQLLP